MIGTKESARVNWKSLSLNDTFIVTTGDYVNQAQAEMVRKLYQPILGPNGYGLYLTMISLIKKHPIITKRTLHRRLLRLSGLNLPDFYESRIRLEALGLLRTFEQNDALGDVTIYELQAPLNASRFWKDDLLNSLLLESVGEDAYNELREEISAHKVSKFKGKEVTKGFLDVFDPRKDIILADRKVETIHPNKQRIESITSDLDLNLLYNLANKSYIPSKEIKNNLPALKTARLMYGIDEIDTVRLLEQAYNINTNKVNINEFKRMVHSQFEYQVNVGDDNVSKEIANISNDFSETEKQLILASRSYTPMEFILNLHQRVGGYVTPEERRAIENAIKAGAKNEIINILIHYILINKSRGSVKITYFDTIINDWLRNGVKNAQDAIIHVRNLFEQKEKKEFNKKVRTRKVIEKEKLPDWAKDEYKEQEVSNEVSRKKVNDMLKRWEEKKDRKR